VDRIAQVREQDPHSDPSVRCGIGSFGGLPRRWPGLPAERTVFELRHYEGLRLRTIGDMIGTTEEAAKNCLFRATQKMRMSLEAFV